MENLLTRSAAIFFILIISGAGINAQIFQPGWQRNINGYRLNIGNDLVVDKDNNIIVVGIFKGTDVDFGGVSFTSPDVGNIFIAKYTSGNELMWAKNIGGDGRPLYQNGHQLYNDEAKGVGVDDSGNIYVTGSFSGTDIDFDPEHPDNPDRIMSSVIGWGGDDKNIFLVKYTPEGRFVWGKSIGDDTSEYSEAVHVDQSGNVYITGQCTGFSGAEIDFDPGAEDNPNRFIPPAALAAGFFAKYNSDGKLIWVTSAHATFDLRGKSIITDQDGNVYTCGYFQGSNASFKVGSSDPAHSISSQGNGDFGSPTDVFLCKHDKDGVLQWVKGIGSTARDEALGLTTDESGAVYITGFFEGTNVDFDRQHDIENDFLSSQGQDMFLARYLPEGKLDWARAVGGNTSNNDIGHGVHYSQQLGLFVTGEFSGQNIDFGGQTVTSTSSDYTDAFLALYDTEGNTKMAAPFGAEGSYSGRQLAIASEGQVYISGTSSNEASVFMDNIFLQRFDAMELPKTMEVSGNNLLIQNNDLTPDINDNTDFGLLKVNASASKTFTIKNRGANSLEISAIEVAGEAAGDFEIVEQTPLTVSAGSEKSFTISFSPTDEGTRSVMVKIISNDKQTPEFTFSIQGTGEELLTKIASKKKESHFSIYPVPGNGQLYITGTSSCNCNQLAMKAYNSQGKLVGKTHASKLSPNDDRMVVDFSYLPKGYYILEFYYDQEHITLPFILKP